MTTGRPLRFLTLLLLGWTAWRAAWLWPGEATASAPHAARETAESGDALAGYRAFRERFPLEPPLFGITTSDLRYSPLPRPAFARAKPVSSLRRSFPELAVTTATLPAGMVALPPLSKELPAIPSLAAAQRIPVVVAPVAQSAIPSVGRWSGSGWTILRGGGGRDFAGGRLGAAQAGARVTYALGDARRVAIAGRVSSPIEGRGREAALGIDWRPTRLPVHLLAEQRVGLDRSARSGPALSLIGGLDPLPIAAGFRLEGYGQVGVARLGGFVDGGARLARPVARFGGMRIDLGIGAWGGAQPGAARLDVGPGAALVVPLADRSLRLTLDWRARIAGRAAPGSGPALSIGTDL